MVKSMPQNLQFQLLLRWLLRPEPRELSVLGVCSVSELHSCLLEVLMFFYFSIFFFFGVLREGLPQR